MRPPRGAWGALLLLATSIGPAFAIAAGLRGPALASLALSLTTAALGLWSRAPHRAPPRLLLALALAAGVPVHYAATARVFEALEVPLRDLALARVDEALLGWLWPGGQLAIAVDRSAVVGPGTPLGRVLSEALQVGYFSYYVWGYGLLFLLLARFRRSRDARAWDLVRAFLVAWVGAYLLNFLLYLAVPAMGPWWAFPEWFTRDVEGLFLAAPLRALIAGNQVTPDCFPSGHTALSWITAIVALRVAPRYGRIALAAAVVITVATLWLRYHYAVDLLAAIPLGLAGLAWGGWLSRRREVQAGEAQPA